MVVDIEPFDQTGHATQFDGSLSLMLVASNGKGQQQKLSRWDFSADEVRTALVADTNEPAMRFHVELPADAKVSDANELWVRLVPTSGGKMLTHAKIDLSQPGVFSSRTDKLWASEESVVATNYEEPVAKPAETSEPETPAIAAPFTAPMTEGTWAVAQPDKPAVLPPESDRTTGGWRASSEPMPAIVNTTTPSKTVWNDRPTPLKPNLRAPHRQQLRKSLRGLPNGRAARRTMHVPVGRRLDECVAVSMRVTYTRFHGSC